MSDGPLIPRMFHADADTAFGQHFAQFAWLDLDLAASARTRLAAAVAAKSDLLLTVDEANALIVWLSLKATALRFCTEKGPGLPVFVIDRKAGAEAEKQNAIASVMSGAAALGIDPTGPVRGFSDASSRAIIMAIRGACAELGPKGSGKVLTGVKPPKVDPPKVDPAVPDVLGTPDTEKTAYIYGSYKGYTDGYAGAPFMAAVSAPVGMAPALAAKWEEGYTNGYKRGAEDRLLGKVPNPPTITGGGTKGFAGAPVIIGAIAAGAVLVGGAILLYKLGQAEEKAKGEAVRWDATKASSIHLTDRAADSALERYRLIAESGKYIEPSPLEKGAADAVTEMGKAPARSDWTTIALGAVLGAGAVVGGKWAADRFLGRRGAR